MISFAKKFLSIALAAVLLVGVIPAAAFAAEAEPEVAVEAVPEAAPEAAAQVDITYYKRSGSYEWNGGAGEWTKGYKNDHLELTDGKYILTQNDLQAPSYTVDGMTFKAWHYKAHPADVAKVGDEISGHTNLIPEFVPTEPKPTEPKPTEPKPTEPKPTEPAEKQKYTVSFKTNCDVADPASITVTENGTYDNLPAVTRTGYTFKGWFYGDTKVENTSKIAANSNHTLEARWAINEYTVTFLKADGSVLTTKTVKHGQKIDSVPNVSEAGTKAGQHASKWDTDTNQVVTGNMTIKPLFSNNTYTITLDPGVSGLEIKTKNVVYGERIGDLPVPSRNRYVFKGWYLDNTEFTANTTYNMDHDITLKAKWVEEARVKLMIYRNGKTSSAYDEVQLYGYGVGDVIKTKDIKIENYYKNGNKSFKFSGWYDREGWTLFKAGDNPKPIEQIKTVGLDGTTVLFGMVTDSNASNNSNPDNSNPKTGDESMIFATTAVMLISAGALAVFFMDRKRRNG